ncbi:MAG: DeoR/GlpR family DNA-binding transcription regulator [Pseudomonadota bacterium]
MLSQQRLDAIRTQLLRDGKVISSDLAVEFGTSEDTIRRDLRDLARSGFCRRVYGGALIETPKPAPISARLQADTMAKHSLAAAAAALVQPGQTLFIDAGSTNTAIAAALSRQIDLTILTNAPTVAIALSDHPRARVVLLGGVLDLNIGAALGGATLHAIRQINADLLFLGSCGVDAAHGISAFDPAEAEVKRAMVDQSAQVIVAATLDKLGTAAPFKVAEATAITHLILPAEADLTQIARFRMQGIEVHLPADPDRTHPTHTL